MFRIIYWVCWIGLCKQLKLILEKINLSDDVSRSSNDWNSISVGAISSDNSWTWSSNWLGIGDSNGNSQSDEEEDGEQLGVHVEVFGFWWGNPHS